MRLSLCSVDINIVVFNMMYCVLIILIAICVNIACADCNVANFAKDPTPWGGAPCTKDLDCGGSQAGTCDLTIPAGKCVCPKNLAMPNCSYTRTNPGLAGGLNIGLPFIGIGGVGDLIIGGARTGFGAGQLVMMLSLYFILCALPLAFACDGAGMIIVIILYVIFGLATFAGFLWSIIDGAFILQCAYPDAKGYWMMN
jgi:hypothetical protein